MDLDQKTHMLNLPAWEQNIFVSQRVNIIFLLVDLTVNISALKKKICLHMLDHSENAADVDPLPIVSSLRSLTGVDCAQCHGTSCLLLTCLLKSANIQRCENALKMECLSVELLNGQSYSTLRLKYKFTLYRHFKYNIYNKKCDKC